jgi:hypothetical protein
VYSQAEEPYDSEEEEETNEDAKRGRSVYAASAVVMGLFFAGTATLLSVIVPQKCGAAECTYNDTMCSDWGSCSPLQQATLLVNWATFFVNAWGLLWFWTREKWMMAHLLRHPHQSDRALPKVMVKCVRPARARTH